MTKNMLVVLAVFLFAFPVFAHADDAADFPKTPEGKVLDQYVGDWQYVGPDKKAVGVKEEWILGGRWEQTSWSGGICFYTYDADQKTYVGYRFTKDGGPEKAIAKWDADTRTFTATLTSTPAKGSEIDADHFNGDGTITTTMTKTDDKGKTLPPEVYQGSRTKVPAILPADDAVDFPRTPEGKILGQYVGEWHTVGADKKAPTEDKYEWILGGRWLQIKYAHDILLASYDTDEKNYVLYRFRSDGGPDKFIGKWNADAKTMIWTFTSAKGSETDPDRFNDDGTMTSTYTEIDANGKVISESVEHSTRKK